MQRKSGSTVFQLHHTGIKTRLTLQRNYQYDISIAPYRN